MTDPKDATQLTDLDAAARDDIAANPQAGPNLDTEFRATPENLAKAVDDAIERLLEAAHTAAELLVASPDTETAVKASLELTEAALAVTEAQAQARK